MKALSDSELEIMNIIWANEPPVSRSLVEKELCQDRQLAPSTIITFLTRLCDKGFLMIEKAGRTNLYTPLITKDQYLSEENKNFIKRFYNGSFSDFAAALCKGGISKEDKAELLRMLEEEKL